MNQIDYDHISRQIIDDVVKISFRQFVRKIEVGVEDVISAVIEELQEKSLHAILETITFYTSISKEEGFLFPDGTRFLFNCGNSKIVVIEEKPQIRTLRLDESLWGLQKDQRGAIKDFRLAFPYVIFICMFADKLQSLCVYFRNEPLRSLDSDLYKAVFSNLGSNDVVCTSDQTWDDSDPLNVKIETAIADFWQSNFTSDSDIYWRAREKIDSRLNLSIWRLQSQTQPLFPCSVEWTRIGPLGERMKIISSWRDAGCQEASSGDRVSEYLGNELTHLTHELSAKLAKYLTTERLEKLCPKNIQTDLKKVVQGLCFEMETVIRSLVIQLEEARHRIDRQDEIVQWENEHALNIWEENYR